MNRGTQTVLSRRRFDVHEYHRMLQAGILHEDDRVELLEGQIVQMAAIGSRHHSCVGRLNRLLVGALSDRAFVSIQGPVRLDRYSEPEPDVALLRPRDDDYAGGHPGPEETLLVIEVADSSLRVDRQLKLPLYAGAGVPEAWIVDLTDDSIEIHREPRGSSYRSCDRLTEGTLSPLAFPDLQLPIEEILPPRV